MKSNGCQFVKAQKIEPNHLVYLKSTPRVGLEFSKRIKISFDVQRSVILQFQIYHFSWWLQSRPQGNIQSYIPYMYVCKYYVNGGNGAWKTLIKLSTSTRAFFFLVFSFFLECISKDWKMTYEHSRVSMRNVLLLFFSGFIFSIDDAAIVF